MACFVRQDILNEPQIDAMNDAAEPDVSPFPVEKFEYKRLFQNDFPIHVDSRTEEEIIMDNVTYFFNRFIYKFDEDFYYSLDRDRYEFPLQQIFECVHDAPDYDQLKTIVTQNYLVDENDVVVVPVPDDNDSSSDFEGSDNNESSGCHTKNADDIAW